MTRAVDVAGRELPPNTALGVRNLIINGDMRIAQRGTSTTGVTSDGYYSVDRMRLDNTNLGTWTHSQDTDVPSGQGFTHSLKMQCTTADASPASTDLLAHNFRLEGQMLQHLKYGTSSAETLTVSFWVKSNKTGTYVVDLRHVDATLNYGKAYTIDTADTWEKKSFTFEGETTTALDNDNNQSLQLNFWLGAGSDFSSGTQNTTWSNVNADRAAALTVNLADSTSNYINITGVQLEVGDTATPFEHRPYDMELARCQRYYYKQTGVGVGNRFAIGMGDTTTNINTVFPSPVNFRSTPTVSYSNINLRNGTTDETISSTNYINAFENVLNMVFVVSTTATAGAVYMVRATASGGYIDFSAEL